MGCPYFEIQKTDEFDNIAEIITADRQSRHFIRRRTYSPSKLADTNRVMHEFNYADVRHKDGTFVTPLKVMGGVSAVMIIISGIFLVGVEPSKVLDGLAIYLTALLFIALFGVFLYCHLKEQAFVKTVAHLFILYDSAGEPYSVEIQGKRIRVIYKGRLFVIKRGKAKEVKSMRLRYYAYLNLYPQSVLDMGRFLDNSDKSYSAVLVPTVTYTDDGSGVLTLDCHYFNNGYTSPTCWDKHTQFLKYVFVVDKNLNLSAVYSAAREDALISDDILTKAEEVSRGQAAEDDLKFYVYRYKALEKILEEIK